MANGNYRFNTQLKLGSWCCYVILSAGNIAYYIIISYSKMEAGFQVHKWNTFSNSFRHPRSTIREHCSTRNSSRHMLSVVEGTNL